MNIENSKKTTLAIEDPNKVNDILQDNTLDIILELMDNQLTEDELAVKLNIPPLRLQYCLLKLKNLGIIESVEESIVKENIRIKYKLKSENIDLIINLTEESKQKIKSLVGFNNYNRILKKVFKFASKNSDLTSKHGAVFIHSSEENIAKFKEKLNKLIQEFIEIEINDEKNGYVFLPMLFPYEIREKLQNEDDIDK